MQVDALAHRREGAAGHDRARGAEVLDERPLVERAPEEVPVADVALQIPAQAVDPALAPGAAEDLGERLVRRRGLVDEEVLAALRRRRQDLGPEHRRVERRARLRDRRVEERRHEVVEAPRQLRLHDPLREEELGLVARDDVGRVIAAVHDLDVVHRDAGEAARAREQVAPGLEVRDHHLGPERLGEVEPGLHVPRPAAERGAPHVREHGPEVPDLVVLVDDREPPDPVHAEAIPLAGLEVVVRAAGDDDLHVVAPREVVDDDPRADRVPHALADHAVEDARHRF